MPRVADHLVGRASELRAADAALAAVADGRGAALLLAGDPGIGKTRLLAELQARAGVRDFLVLHGSASELERDLPFWVFVDALDEHVAALEPRRIGEDVAAELGRILPALAGAARGPAGPADLYRTHGAVRALLERLAVATPLVLTLDDVHWADDASVDLLAALLRRPPAAAVLFAMATRPRQLPDRLARAMERAAREDALTRLDLTGLERSEAGELLGDAVDAERADTLYAESGGNPFYLEQLARVSGHGRGAVQLHGVEVPEAVRASLGEELALLSAPTRRVLEGSAVAGDPFEPELAAAAAALDEPGATGALDELLGLGLVHPTDVPRRFRFRHPLVRRAVYESAPAAWRLGAHERCAAALERRGAPPTARAHHVEHAGRRGDLAAVAVLADAAEAALPRAPASAAAWYSAALRLLPESAPAEQHAHLLMSRGKALGAMRRLAEAHADVLAALELVPGEAVAWWVALTVAAAALEHRLGLHAEARGRLADALHRLPDPGSREAVDLLLELAIGDVHRARYASMLEWANRAVAVARPLGDRLLLATAAATAALAEALGGMGTGGPRIEAAALVESMSDDELARRPAAVAYLGAVHLYEDRYEAAVAQCERLLAIERATGHGDPTVWTTLALAKTMLGELDDAARVLDGVIEQIRVVGIAQGLAFHLAFRAIVALAAGDDERATRAAAEAYELTRPLEAVFMSAWSTVALGAAVCATDPARAAQLLAPHGDEVPPVPGAWPAMALEVLTRSRLAAGRRDEARRAAERAAEIAEAVSIPMAASWAQRAAAEVALERRDAAAAAEHARAAVAAAESAGAVLEIAAARAVAGRALAAAGETDGAVTELEAAAAAFQEHDATRRRDAVEQELRKLGRAVHRRSRRGSADGGLAALTGRELEVAELVVDRRTNPEIAAELFLSLKTVETHLRNIFRKLGVSSRVELARAVERTRRS